MIHATKKICLFACTVFLGISCKQYLPVERENIGLDTEIANRTFSPILGRNTVFSDVFFKGSTSFPATFKVINVRRRSGDDAPELRNVLPVKVWKSAYTGLETSLEEIELKRTVENRPVFEIGEKSGNLMFWSSGNSNFIRTVPDSGYLFDLEISNSGGRRYFQDLQIQPRKEVPYTPSNFDELTGMPTSFNLSPNAPIFLTADTVLSGLSNLRIGNGDISLSFNKKLNSNKSQLTFRFLDRDNKFINPDKFSDTDWENLIHGFNMVKTATGVTYDVAYPIPLARVSTRFTSNGGTTASVRFAYRRIGFGNAVEENYFGLNFAIYEPGDWEIIFRFINYNPKFTND